MTFTQHLVVTAVLTAGIAAGSASAASASGPVWNHGTTGSGLVGTSYSHYFHPSSCHGATAVGRTTVRTADIGGGFWARADAPRAIANNQAYRRTC
ncbi:lactococcin 972 family bacteriocin [Nocardiopsis eucommiae]|uniref:lactococcin 972 family bacteriocin n=1 Tax=Nocardiopsis eucommiae TaxID=2831970 RepID=UPI003D754BFD